MIIDFHTHIFPDKIALRAITDMALRGNVPFYADGSLGNLLEHMRRANIDYAMLQPVSVKPGQSLKINRWMAGLNQPKLIPFGAIHPDDPNLNEVLDYIVSMGWKGIKLHADFQDFYLRDKRLRPFFESVFQRDLIVLIHGGMDESYANDIHAPAQEIAKLAKSFPYAKIVAAHFGAHHDMETSLTYLIGKNIYIDISLDIVDTISQFHIREIFKKHDPQKILFGSDYPWGNPLYTLNKLQAFRLKSEVEEAILSGNAKQLLGL
jgi:predicted TIM-barrel fold metal-dependent hydrolase